VNQDGYVGPAEGAELDGLTENWQLLDIDKDGHLDKTEFSKFEIMITPPEGPRE
jgi:Ca2+-binding EF-hand superfamily protein